VLAPADATGLAFTVTTTVAAALVQLAEVTVTEYDPLLAVVGLLTVNAVEDPVTDPGPDQEYVGLAAPDDAVNVKDSPTQTLLSDTTTVGAAGDPGFVTL
jgi:hypothetical protein